MIALLLALIMMIAICGGTLAFVVWAVREHHVANKYRYLIRLHNTMPQQTIATGPRWSVTHKTKGKSKTEIVEAKTEGEALRKFVGADKIISCEKV